MIPPYTVSVAFPAPTTFAPPLKVALPSLCGCETSNTVGLLVATLDVGCRHIEGVADLDRDVPPW